MSKRVGYLGTCATPYCGAVHGYFCVRCRHYVTDCACGFEKSFCECSDAKGWAAEGERRQVIASLAIERMAQR